MAWTKKIAVALVLMPSVLFADVAETYLVWTSSFANLNGFRNSGRLTDKQPLYVTKVITGTYLTPECAIVELVVPDQTTRNFINTGIASGRVLHLWDISFFEGIENGRINTVITKIGFNPIPGACYLP